MRFRFIVLTAAAVLSVVGFAGHIPEGWAGAAIAAVALVEVWREHRRLKLEAQAAKAFAHDAYEGFQMICEAAPVFVWTGDVDGSIDFVNKCMRDFVGSRDPDWRQTIHEDDLPLVERYFADLLLGLEPPAQFIRVRRHDGEWRWMWSVARAQGMPVRRMVGIGIDATAWKDAEHELAELVEAKHNFLAVMSHELRTPLTAIIGFCGLLREGIPVPLPQEDLESVERIEEAATRLQILVDEVLFFNNLQNAQERVRHESVDPAECIMAVQELLQPRARQLGLAIAIDVTYAPKVMNTDSIKLRRALANLVNNALKFTRKGTVTIRVVEGEKTVEFSVIDPGIGIDVQAQRHVFEPFWQQRQSMVREVGGMGLGLAVCHRIAALLGGSMTVESQPNYGSTFKLVLPK